MLDFDYLHDGSWEAWGNAGRYQIDVCKDGEFVVNYTDDETGDDATSDQSFLTYREARDWCNTTENTLKHASVVKS